MIVNGYVTLAEAKSWIRLTDTKDDELLGNVITSVSRWIDGYCQRQFWQATAQARYFDTSDGYLIDFGALNDLVSVTTLKTDTDADGVYETTWAVSAYQLLPQNVTAPEARPYESLHSVNGQQFPKPTSTGRIGLVEITGTWGWPAIPATVSQACRLQVSRIYKRIQSPEGVAGFGEFGQIRISGHLDPDVEDMLEMRYRRPVFA
jgi:Phage gp6-like head-tail connector protein